jgi:VCBS repeat-containing protein
MENDLIFGTETSDMLTGNDAGDRVQIAAATTNGEPYADAVAVPLDAAQVEIPQGENVVRVPVQPGEVVELPFPADSQFLAREDNGNLAIKVGDITVILQGYVEAAGATPPVIEASNGQPLDIATILASTDPNIDIQTAAGPAAGPQGQGADNTGGILQQFGPGAGLGGFEGAGAQDGTDGLGGGIVDQTGTLFRQFGLLVNTAPTAQDDTLKTNEDTPISGQVVAVDPDGDPLTYAVVGTLPAGVTFGPDGTWAFDPTTLKEYQELDDGDSLTISFQYNATDGTNLSNTATVTIDVAGVNDAPIAQGDVVTTNEDTPITGQVVATDVDKNDTLTYSLASALPAGVTFNAATGTWAFDPTGIKEYQELNVGQTKTISFDYKVNDGTVDSNVATVTINVDGVNDNPVFLGGTIENFPPRSEDAGDTHVDLNWVFVDIDDVGAATLTVDPTTLPPGVTFDQAQGRLYFDTDGKYDYLAPGQIEKFVIKFTATDAHGGTTEQDYTLVMEGKADASPHAVPDTILTNVGPGSFVVFPEWSLIANDKDASAQSAFGLSGVFSGGLQATWHPGPHTYDFQDDATLGGTTGYKLSDGSTANITIQNQAGGDLTGTTAHEIIVSGSAAGAGDKIDGKGGQDIIFGGDGDDSVIFHNGDIVVGGSDSITKSNGFTTDNAALRGDVLVVDHDVNFVNTHLTTVNGGSSGGIETISTAAADGGAGKQVVTIGASEVTTLSDHTVTPGGLFAEERAIKIDGDAVDQLYLSISKDPVAGGGWADTGQDVNGYHVFAHETTAGNAATADAYVMVQAANVANVHLNQDPT